ncbi:MAG TPA: glutamine amidotransferase [Verrucomicrobiae bacterium]|nr:glutamine amidotransferase [Verrucomicrobiae bacterium]
MKSGPGFFPEITFLNPLPGPVLFFLALAAAVFFFSAFHRFSVKPSRRLRLALAVLRALALGLVFLILLDPYTRQRGRAEWMGVLVDTSASMGIAEPGEAAPRFALLQAFLEQDAAWKKNAKLLFRTIETFDAGLHPAEALGKMKPEGKASQLVAALQEIDSRYRNDPDLLGWIVFTDGAATDAPPQPGRIFGEFSFPWIAVQTASEKEIPNVRMLTPEMRPLAFAGEIIPAKVRWTSNLEPKTKLSLKVRVGEKEVLDKLVEAGDGAAELEIQAPEAGDYPVEAALHPLDAEGARDDNSARAWLRVVPRRVRVFYIESFYKDENRFKKALETDADFDVTFAASLLGFARKNQVPFIKDPLYGLPQKRENFFQYDAIVLSDVKRSLLSPDQVRWTRQLVEEQGGALIMIGGMDSFGDGGYVGTEIEAMLPVEISEEYKKDVFLAAKGKAEKQFRPVLVKGAEAHPLVRLVDDPSENANLWANIPLLGGYNYVGRLKPGATAILQHPADESTFGPRVILAVQNYGRGKVAAFTSDVTPNWGTEFQDWKDDEHGWLFAKFWRNALKWLTENRVLGRASALDIQISPDLAEAHEEIEIRVRVPEDAGPGAALRAELSKDGAVAASHAFSGGFENAAASWTVYGLEAGDYAVRVFYSAPDRMPVEAEKRFTVHESRRESDHLKGDSLLLKELTARTHGVYLPFEDAGGLESAIEKIRKVQLRRHAAPFWNRPGFYLALLALLMADWLLRKKKGLD